MKMISSLIFCVLFMFVVCSMAKPITEEVVLDPSLTPIDILKHKHKATKLEKAAGRQDRQGFANPYPYNGYDYYGYPYPAYNEYPYYSGYNQPQAYYPYPSPVLAPATAPAPAPTVYAPTHSYTQTPNRRSYRPNDRSEATSQKYTVWDLARK